MDDFTRDFWDEKVRWHQAGDATPRGEPTVRTADGVHYVIGRENVAECIKGFGGNPWEVEFTSGPHVGKTIRTTNLWHQGTIPDSYRDRLTPNAILRSARAERFQGYRPA